MESGGCELQMAPKGYSLRGWMLLRDDLRQWSFRCERVFDMKIDLGARSGVISGGCGVVETSGQIGSCGCLSARLSVV